MGKDEEILKSKESKERLRRFYGPGFDDPSFYDEDEPIDEAKDREILKGEGRSRANFEETEKRAAPVEDDEPMDEKECQQICESMRADQRSTLRACGYSEYEVGRMVPEASITEGKRDQPILPVGHAGMSWRESKLKLSDFQILDIIEHGDDEECLEILAQDPARFRRLLEKKKAEDIF